MREKNRTGRGMEDWTELNKTRQDRTGQDKTGQDRTGQDRTGKNRTNELIRNITSALNKQELEKN